MDCKELISRIHEVCEPVGEMYMHTFQPPGIKVEVVDIAPVYCDSPDEAAKWALEAFKLAWFKAGQPEVFFWRKKPEITTQGTTYAVGMRVGFPSMGA